MMLRGAALVVLRRFLVVVDPVGEPLWNGVEGLRFEERCEVGVGEELPQRARDNQEAFLGAVRACPKRALFCGRAFVCADDGLRVEAFGADTLGGDCFSVFSALSKKSLDANELSPA